MPACPTLPPAAIAQVYDNPDAKTSTAPDERDAGRGRYQGWNKPSSAPSNEDLGHSKVGLGGTARDVKDERAPRYGARPARTKTQSLFPAGSGVNNEPDLPEMEEMDMGDGDRVGGKAFQYGGGVRSQPMQRQPGQAPTHEVRVKGTPPKRVEALSAPAPAPAPTPAKKAAKKAGMLSKFFGGFGKKR